MYAVCKRAGCKALIEVGSTYCPSHKRGSSTDRGYDWEWRKIATALVREVGHCEWPMCGATTDLTVDHRNGVVTDRRRSNLWVLCRSHNTKRKWKHNREWKPV